MRVLDESQKVLPRHRQQGEEMGINVLVSDKKNVSRHALTALLEQGKGIQIAGSVADNLEAIEFADTHHPDVVIFSFDGADSNVLTVAEKITGPAGMSMPAARRIIHPVGHTPGIHRRNRRNGPAECVPVPLLRICP
nr:response regulator transcription factor [Streptomyces sp. HB202]